MPELIAKTALAARAPLVMGDTELAEVDHGAITSIAVMPGKSVDKALKPLGFSFPTPNSFVENAGALLIWTGRDQAVLIGAEAPDFAAALAGMALIIGAGLAATLLRHRSAPHTDSVAPDA